MHLFYSIVEKDFKTVLLGLRFWGLERFHGLFTHFMTIAHLSLPPVNGTALLWHLNADCTHCYLTYGSHGYRMYYTDRMMCCHAQQTPLIGFSEKDLDRPLGRNRNVSTNWFLWFSGPLCDWLELCSAEGCYCTQDGINTLIGVRN